MRALTFTDHRIADRRARVIAAFAENGVGSTATLVSLLSALYRTLPDALGHAQRVASVATRIGSHLGFSTRELDHLERAAWLHDLGKFLVPDLDDEPGLDDEDTERMYTSRWAQQLDFAVDVIERVPVLVPAAVLVRASRECIDGSGYPRGLRGGEIPLGARVLHVADSFDALSSVCASLGVDQGAVPVELVRNAGSRFDPAVVSACLRALDTPPQPAQGL